LIAAVLVSQRKSHLVGHRILTSCHRRRATLDTSARVAQAFEHSSGLPRR